MKLLFLKPSTEFGSCCKALHDAMQTPPNSLFRVSEDGVFYLTVGYVQTEEGLGWMDQAVIFCPFCGRRLQSEADIREKSAGAPKKSAVQ
jgi:hypothetical protein